MFMGLRFRRSRRFGPLRVNVSRSGISESVGVRGVRVGRNKRGTYLSLALLGTGLSWIGYRKKRR
jgi:hypothetical protein